MSKIATILLALFFVAAFSSPTSQQTSQPNKQQTISQPRPSATAISSAIQKQPNSTPQRQSPSTHPRKSRDECWKAWKARLLSMVTVLWQINWSNWVLMVIAIWATRTAVRTLKNIERQSIAAEQQVTKLDEGLRETRKTAETAIAQASAAREQAEIARMMFVLTQRPKLIVRNVVITAPAPPAIQGEIPLFQPGYEITGTLYAVNVGGTIATTNEYWCGVSKCRANCPWKHLMDVAWVSPSPTN